MGQIDAAIEAEKQSVSSPCLVRLVVDSFGRVCVGLSGRGLAGFVPRAGFGWVWASQHPGRIGVVLAPAVS